ncbi:hypothetical protein QYE76_066048 [Lolium multiflorum]|uniref:RING-type E3 ubiquitin transferase n=1 Tax=Lolium multiflorum TaxID=4521 RepID=A0AAD8W9F9_LOLMU|nr:hypothetical protein QYE76_066048 [Lolium multiflorum]
MPPPPENHPLPPPRPRPKPKPPKPKPPKPRPAAVRDQTHGVAVPLPPDPIACALHCSQACALHSLCAPPPPPPPSRTTTLHLQSSRSRLPTPLIALSASLLAVSVLLLLVLLVCRVVRWRRRRQPATTHQQQHAPLNHHNAVDEEGGPVPLAPAPADEQDSDDGGDGMHHVWYIKTVGLDERAIAAITALVYDADKCRAAGLGADGGCAVCLAEFRDGETLRLLPRCAHAFHRACIDTWLRAHVNCPLCRAPVKVASANAATLGGEPAANLGVAAGAEEEAGRDGDDPSTEDRALRRAASMLALPRRAWPDVDSLRAPASNSARQGEMGLAKITRVLKLSEALEMAGIGERRSASFSAAPSLRLPGRSAQPAAGASVDEVTR